jgi:hypothetical protein
MLKAAYQAGDANRVVHFFNAYVAEQAALHGQQPNQTQQQPASPPPVSLETLAAPGRGGASAPQGQPQKRIWTSQDVKKLYDDQRRGHFNGRESNFRALEQDLFAAQVEGRYRQ